MSNYTNTPATTDLTSPKDAFVDSHNMMTEYGQTTWISTGSRTGTKVHAGTFNSTQTLCGRWLKFAASAYRVYAPVNCGNCLDTTTMKDA